MALKEFWFVWTFNGRNKVVVVRAMSARDARDNLIARGYNIVSGPYDSKAEAERHIGSDEEETTWWFVISHLVDEGETKTDVRSVTSKQLSKWKWAINEGSARRYLESYGYTVVSGPYGSEAEARAHAAGKRTVDIAHGWTDEQIEALKKRFKSEYGKARREMRGKIKAMLAEYDEKNEEWKALLASGKVTQKEYDAWLKGQAAQKRYVQDIADILATDARHADELAMDAINDVIPYVYAENANRAAFDIEKGIGYDTHSFDLYDQSTVRRLIRDQPELLPPIPEARLDKRKDKRWNKQKFSSAITQAILQGDSIPQASERLMRVLKMDEDSAVRAARTAITGAENAGRVDSFRRAKRIGIDLEQQWMATLDMRTRHSHRQLDGQHVPVGEKFKVDGVELEFPADPTAPPEYVYNCRCTLVAWFEGIDIEDPERLSRLPDGMSYDDWKNQKQRQMEERARAEAEKKSATIEELQKKIDELEAEVRSISSPAHVFVPTDKQIRDSKKSMEEAERSMQEYAWAADLDKDAVQAENRRLYDQYDEMEQKLQEARRLRRSGDRGEEYQRLKAEYDEWLEKRGESDRQLDGITSYERRKREYESRKQWYEGLVHDKETGLAKQAELIARRDDAILRRNRAYGELSAIQPFAPKVRDVVGDDFADAMERKIAEAEARHPEIAAAYRRFSSQLTVIESDLRDGAFYRSSDRGIHFNAREDMRGSNLDAPLETAFHEFGHMIDHISGHGYTYQSSMNALNDAIKKDWNAFRNANSRGTGLRRAAEKNQHVIDMIRGEGARRKLREYGNLSDIVEGCTGTSYPFGAGHGASYHRRTDATAREFIAEVFDSSMTNEESYQQMKRVFPNAVAMAEDIAREITR